MTVIAKRVSVASATALNDADPSGCFLLVKNKGSASVFLGDAAVSTTSGFELATSDSAIQVSVGPDEVVYAAASTTQRVDVLATFGGL